VQPTGLCAHYYINRSCRLGRSCHFIHVANVDSAAAPGKKAKKRASIPSLSESVNSINLNGSVNIMNTSFNANATPQVNNALNMNMSRRYSERDLLSDSGNSADTEEVPSSFENSANSSTATYYVHNPYNSYRAISLVDM